MRKLSPYDHVVCFCKEPMTIIAMEGGGQQIEGGSKCECITSGTSLSTKTYKQFKASMAARKLKPTRFKVAGILVSNVKVVQVIKTGTNT